ncbi:MAG TPA: hypothetical protein VNB59_07230 [Solirubrobacterales bacterium]|jgi:hypothetical protein|nr:hypothetical protein [Solirubrobacterales bacterium]
MSRDRRKDPQARQRALRATTAERLEAIVEAAERAAESVIDDAEAQARHYLAETRARADREASQRISTLAEMTDSLLEEARALRRQAERLQATLEGAKARIDSEAPSADLESEEQAGQAQVSKVAHLTPVAPPEEPFSGHSEEPEPVPRRSAAGARLLATQMAVSGSSREEIEERLRNGFEVEDTAAILDAILGPED